MGKKRIYSIYRNSELIMKDGVEQIACRFHVSYPTIYNCCQTGEKLQGKYEVKIDNPFEKEYESVKKHLRIYGNTSLVKWRQKIVDDLEAEGYKLKITKYETKKKRNGNGRIEDMGNDWVVEVINGKEEKES